MLGALEYICGISESFSTTRSPIEEPARINIRNRVTVWTSFFIGQICVNNIFITINIDKLETTHGCRGAAQWSVPIAHWWAWCWFIVRYIATKSKLYWFIYQCGKQGFRKIAHWFWGTIYSIIHMPITCWFILQAWKRNVRIGPCK